MLFRAVWMLGAVLALAVPAAAAPSSGVRVVAKGTCVVQGGIRAQDGTPAKAWDMWQEIFVTSWPTWLQVHTHRGAECIMNVYGVTGWWFAHGGASPNSPPTIVPVAYGKTVYTVQGRVHTAGNVEPRMQGYFGIHLLEQGSQFNYPVNDPSAPPFAKTIPLSVFKNEFPNQVPSVGTVTIANQVIELAKGATFDVAASQSLGYYTFVGGGGTVTLAGKPAAPIVPGTTYPVGRNQRATFTTTIPSLLIATELVPGPHP